MVSGRICTPSRIWCSTSTARRRARGAAATSASPWPTPSACGAGAVGLPRDTDRGDDVEGVAIATTEDEVVAAEAHTGPRGAGADGDRRRKPLPSF